MTDSTKRFGTGFFKENPFLYELSQSKNFSQFKIRMDISGKDSVEPKYVPILMSIALKNGNYEFIDVFAEVVEKTNFFDTGIKKYWKSFLRACGKYIASNYNSNDKSFFMAMCTLVSVIRKKYPFISEKAQIK